LTASPIARSTDIFRHCGTEMQTMGDQTPEAAKSRGPPPGVVPRRVRPKFPERWHVPQDRRLWITWAHADRKLREEKVYWVSTSSSAGAPHAAPVWGIWKGERFYFETAPNSVKGRNLRENPRIAVHLQDGLDTVIIEGTAARERDSRTLRSLRTHYTRKYDYTPDWSDEGSQVVYEVVPRIAHAWKAPGMHRTLVNFLF